MSDARLTPLLTWRSSIASADGPADFELGDGRVVRGSTQRSVALVLSLWMSEKGTGEFPPLAELAEAADVSARSAQRAILALRRTGWLELIRGGGGRPESTNEYRATLPPRGDLGSPQGCPGVTGDLGSPLATPPSCAGARARVSPNLGTEDLLGKPGKSSIKKDGLQSAEAREPTLTDDRYFVVERILASCKGTDAGSRGVLSSFASRLHISVLEPIALEVERSPRHVGSVVKTLKALLTGEAEKRERAARRLEVWLANVGRELAHDADVFREEIRAVGIVDADVAEAYRRRLLAGEQEAA